MSEEQLEAIKKQQKILYIVVPLTAFMALMKYLGLFSVGAFPPYVEAGISFVALIVIILNTQKIKKAEAERNRET